MTKATNKFHNQPSSHPSNLLPFALIGTPSHYPNQYMPLPLGFIEEILVQLEPVTSYTLLSGLFNCTAIPKQHHIPTSPTTFHTTPRIKPATPTIPLSAIKELKTTIDSSIDNKDIERFKIEFFANFLTISSIPKNNDFTSLTSTTSIRSIGSITSEYSLLIMKLIINNYLPNVTNLHLNLDIIVDTSNIELYQNNNHDNDDQLNTADVPDIDLINGLELSKMLQKMHKLEKLHLSGFNPRGKRQYQDDFLSHFSHRTLNTLVLRGVFNLEYTTMISLLEPNGLYELEQDDNSKNDKEQPDQTKRFPCLQTLDLSSCFMIGWGNQWLIESGDTINKHNSHGHNLFHDLLSPINYPNLIHLNLSQTFLNLTNFPLESLSTSPLLLQLESLNLSENPIPQLSQFLNKQQKGEWDSGTHRNSSFSILFSSPHICNLKHLHLSNCSLSKYDIITLLQSPHCSKLESLWLEGIETPDDITSFIASQPNKFNNLKKLEFGLLKKEDVMIHNFEKWWGKEQEESEAEK